MKLKRETLNGRDGTWVSEGTKLYEDEGEGKTEECGISNGKSFWVGRSGNYYVMYAKDASTNNIETVSEHYSKPVCGPDVNGLRVFFFSDVLYTTDGTKSGTRSLSGYYGTIDFGQILPCSGRYLLRSSFVCRLLGIDPVGYSTAERTAIHSKNEAHRSRYSLVSNRCEK